MSHDPEFCIKYLAQIFGECVEGFRIDERVKSESNVFKYDIMWISNSRAENKNEYEVNEKLTFVCDVDRVCWASVEASTSAVYY